MTSPWATFQDPPTLFVEAPPDDEWPESAQDGGYNPAQPWRLRKYDPNSNGKGFDDDIVQQWKQLGVPGGFIRATATYDQLVRFADIRQTRFKGPPTKNGSNTNVVLTEAEDGKALQANGSPSPRCMWKCYADILYAIHREGQIRGDGNGGWIYESLNELTDMMRDFPWELERLENERFGRRSVNNKLVPGFEWLYPFGQHIHEMTANLQAIVTWAKEVMTDPMQHFHQATAKLPPIVQLIMTLKSREEKFENAVGNEHFEDILIDKRIRMISPKAFYEFGKDWNTPVQKWVLHLNNTVKPELAEFRNHLRDRFDYRLLVDWGYGRLWKKLYIPFDTRTQSDKDAIRQFSDFATKHSKLAFDLFAIFPIDLHEMKADPCSVCLTEFGHSELIMETHCNHHFHPACLFTYWDDENRFQNRCPECRTSQGVLREKVEFEAEREDRCYESKRGLGSLENQYRRALADRVAHGLDFGDMPTLMEMWCRDNVEPWLKWQRAGQKQQTPGWDVIE